jgi:transcriptional regulator with XRE-family HTH domain
MPSSGWSRRIVVSQDSRRELAGFLRSRRARITPADVGLPAGPRRRTTGLRREEVAVLAGVSPTWYTYLEQGRDIHPSPEVLDSLARVLALTEDERRYLHTLANGTASTPRPLVGEVAAEELVRQLVATAEHSPYPVYGIDVYCDLVAWNPATSGYYTDFGRLPEGRRNMLRWLLEAPEAKQRLPAWRKDTRDIVARWRGMTVARDGDRRLQALLEEFRRVSPEFGDWWDGHEVRENRSRLRRFCHPQHGEQTLRLIVVRAPDFAPCLVAFHVPVHPPQPNALPGDGPG